MVSKPTFLRVNWYFLWYVAAIGLSVFATSILVTKVQSPLLILAALGVGTGLLIIFLKPEVGLWILVFIVFTRASEVMPGIRNYPSLTTFLSFYLFLVIILRRLLFNELIDGWQRLFFFIGIYGLISLASLLYAIDLISGRDSLVELLKDAFVVLIIAILLRRSITLSRVVWILLAAGIFLGTITAYQQFTNTFSNDYWGFAEIQLKNIVGEVSGLRASGPQLEPNSYAHYMLLLVPLALDRFWAERNRVLRFFALWAFAACILAIIFTFSRSMFIVMVVVIGLTFLQRPPRLTLLLGTALIGLILLQFVPERYTERMATLTYLIPGQWESEPQVAAGVSSTLIQDSSFRGRLSENIAGLQMSLDHPIFGVGLNNFKAHYLRYARELGLDARGTGRASHNLYLEITAELGIIGLGWFLVFQWFIFRGLKQAKETFQGLGMSQMEGIVIAFAISWIGFMLGSIFRHMTYPRYVWLLFAILCALPHIANQELDSAILSEKQGSGHSLINRRV